MNSALYFCVMLENTSILIYRFVQFLRRMAQPYDKNGAMGKRTLLSQEDLEKMVNGVGEMMF